MGFYYYYLTIEKLCSINYNGLIKYNSCVLSLLHNLSFQMGIFLGVHTGVSHRHRRRVLALL